MKHIFLSIATLSFSFSVWSQQPLIQWQKDFGGNESDKLTAVQQTSDGGYILGGESISNVSGNKSEPCKGGNDYWIVKTDVSGKKLWDKTLGGLSEDQFGALQQTSDGGYILGGTSYSGIGGDKTEADRGTNGTPDYWIIKTDASGNKVWDKTFGGDGTDLFISLQQTSDKGYILGGYSTSGISADKSQASQGSYDYWVIKTDSNGNKLWDKRFGGKNTDYMRSVRQTADNGFILCGESISGKGGDKSQKLKGGGDYWIVKIDAQGNKQWDKDFGGDSGDNLPTAVQTLDGGYIIGGSSSSGISGDKSQPSQGGYDYWIIKTNKNGRKQWDKTLGGTDTDLMFSILQTTDGGYVMNGYSVSNAGGDKSQNGYGDLDYWVVKTDANGIKQWDTDLGGTSLDYGFAINQTSDNGFIAGGFSISDIGGNKSQNSKGAEDYWIVKLSAVTNQISQKNDPLQAESVSSSGQLTIYPNPSFNTFMIYFSLENFTNQSVTIQVFNEFGKNVLEKKENLIDGELNEALSLSDNNSSGIYLVRIIAGNTIYSKQILLQR